MLPHEQHRFSSLLQIEVLRPGNIATTFALAHLLLNINEEGHTAGILRLPAAGTGSVFTLEFAAVFGISVTALWHGIEQRLEQEPHVDVFPDGSVTASQMPSGGPFEELAQARMRRKLEIRHEERSMQDLDEYDPFLVHV